MLNGIGMGDADMKKIQLIKRLTNQGYNMQVMAANALKEFLASERRREEAARLEYERQQREKNRILKRIMDSGVRMMGTGFRQAFQWMEIEREAEIAKMAKQRGIMRRMVDSNVRFMSQGWNKLLEQWKGQQAHLKEKMRFILAAMGDTDKAYLLCGYNGLKQRAMMLNGVGMGDAQMKKIQLIKRLTNKGYNLQVMAANCLQEFLTFERNREESARLEYERQQREKDRILKRIMDSNCRMMGTGFRQAFQWMESARETERQLIFRQRGIMNRIVDSNVRIMAQGFNKLIEEWKAQQGQLKDKMKFILASLTDKDKSLLLCGYNGLKTRAFMLNGVGMNAAQQQKTQLIKRLTNQGYNMQVMAANALREFLASERRHEEAARLEYERQQREKDRILKRIMNSNVRMMGIGFRQSFQFMESERDAEIAKMAKQRGIMRRIVDSNVRLMSQGWNKLIEEYKARMSHLKDKMKFVIAALTDADKAFIMCAYNGLKQRALMLNGVGLGDAQMKKIQLIKRLTNTGYNLQIMAINGIKEYLSSERAREEAARSEHERQQREKSRILKRIMDSNVRMMGTGFRQSFQWTLLARDIEIQKTARQRGILRRIVDSNTRFLSQGYVKLLESHKERSRLLLSRLKFVIAALTSKEASYKIMAYNGFKQRTNMLNGIGVTAAGMLKQQ